VALDGILRRNVVLCGVQMKSLGQLLKPVKKFLSEAAGLNNQTLEELLLRDSS
jgi:hypothetical protein